MGEKYLARELAAGAHGADPIVRILAVVRYPRQHALYWPEVAVEVPPVEKGCICRMHALRRGDLIHRRSAVPRSGPSGPPSAENRPKGRFSGRGWPPCGGEGSGTRCGGEGSWAAAGKAFGRRRGRLRNALRRIPLYERSLEWARARALERCGTEDEREILERHAEGVYLRRRQAVRFKKYELEKYTNGN